MFNFIIRLIYIPLFLIGGNGLAIYLVGAGHPKIWLFVLALGFIAIAFLLEFLVPYDEGFNKSHGDRLRDFYHGIVNESANVAGLMMLPVIAGLMTMPSLWPSALPLWVQLVLAIFIADIGITLVHFASHRIDALWKLHAVHHSIKRMYGFNGLMKHPLHQLLETLGGTAPLILIGVPQDVMTLLIVAVVLQLLLQHSNVNYFVGPLRHFLVVNVLHRFHHLKTAEEGDVNFGLFTTFTDRLLGTAYYDKERVIGSSDIGIGAEPDYPNGYLAQLIKPFKG
jgi:sterol desaturase/sphingolipid hydroxylase (fatty acid hydroxylase superfamily)